MKRANWRATDLPVLHFSIERAGLMTGFFMPAAAPRKTR
jgi:hypothetical protein